MVLSMLAILKVGGAYLPLDPGYPSERLSFMLEDAAVATLIAARTSPIRTGPAVAIVDPSETHDAATETELIGPLLPNHPAYVIYTSGSTGRPKGVTVPHRGIVNRVLWSNQAYPMASSDRMLQKTAISFDASGWEIYGPLFSGAQVVLAKPGGEKDAVYLIETMIRQKITRFQAVPTLYKVLVAEPRFGEIDSLTHLFSGGEPLPSELVVQIRERLPDLIFVNLYGPTEASIDATARVVEPDSATTVIAPIGRPIANSRIQILDANGEPTPIGAPGVLHIGGLGLANGYLHRPDLTAALFIPDSFSGRPSARLYRTGDLARYLNSGAVQFLGRSDNQIKLRGYRIEPDEVAAVLATHPGVRDAIAAIKRDKVGQPLLAAYLLAETGAAYQTTDYAAFLGERLPEYMVPSAFLVLDAFPLLPNGKIDWASLPDPGREKQTAGHVPPRDPVETKLAEIWTTVLGLENPGVQDNFYELGGHSISSIMLMNQVGSAFGFFLPIRDFFENPTIEKMAVKIRAAQPQTERQAIAPRPRTGDIQDFPLSFAQQRLWFLYRYDPLSSGYNLVTGTRLTGPLRLDLLERAVGKLVARHEILRTTYAMRDTEPRQWVHPYQPLVLPVIDLSGLADAPALTKRLIAAEAANPFDLENGPVLRISCFRLDRDRHVLSQGLHHISSDGWSHQIFMHEIETLYEAYHQGRVPELAPLPIQYADYAYWQQSVIQEEALADQLNYWRDQLADAPTSRLPLDRPRPRQQDFEGANFQVPFQPETAQSVWALSREWEVSPFHILLAGVKTALARYSGQDDIVVGAPFANRGRAELEGLIGFFINTLPLRTQFSAETTFKDLVSLVKETVLGAQARQEIPFERLIEAIKLERDPSKTPVYQVVVNYQAEDEIRADEARGARELVIENLEPDRETTQFDMVFSLIGNGSDLDVAIRYNPKLFDRSTIARLASHFTRILEILNDHRHTQIWRMPIFSKSELRLLVSGRHGQAGEPEPLARLGPNSFIHGLFEAKVAQGPDAVALVQNGRCLTYHGLNRAANTTAHQLISRGIGPETGVGVCLQRSPEVVLAILAILKTGGYYAPMDPDYPRERLALIAEDSGVRVIVTDPATAGKLPDTEKLTLDGSASAAQVSANPTVALNRANSAYLIYTSGSTGKPKGVSINHRQVVRLFASTQGHFAFNKNDIWTLFHSYAFDFSVWEIWGALFFGGKLVIPDYWTTRSPDDFFGLLVRERASVLNQSPSAFAQLVQLAQNKGRSAAPKTNLRYVIFGAEALDLKTLTPWFEIYGSESPSLVNMYGITETCVHVTYRVIKPEDGAIPFGSPIGVAIADLDLLILDRFMNPVPIGAPGEIYVGGEGPARGYLNRPDLTAARFTPHPYAKKAGERLYQSGDTARITPDGALLFEGRSDTQVKIRGFRIEPGEIQAMLADHPDVLRCHVMAVSGKDNEKALAAYLIAKKDAVLNADGLRTYLGEKLPRYMVPTHFVFLDDFPMTAHGKLDWRKLPEPQTAAARQEYQPPVTETEALLATVWEEALDLERVGREDNFFTLGGDSIISVRLLALAKRYQLNFSLQELFQNQTLKSLAKIVDRGESAGEVTIQTRPFSLVSPELRAQLPDTIEDAYPLVRLQLGMIYHMQLDPELHPYHNVDSTHLGGHPLQQNLLQKAIQRVVDRHPALRTGFHLSEYGEPIQVIHKTAALPLRWFDLRGLDQPTQRQELQAYLDTERQTLFDLSKPTLLRMAIHLFDDDDFTFSLTECHPILDGWSLTSILAEIFHLYFRFVDEGEVAPEPPPAGVYRDYVAAEMRAIANQETRLFWDRYLENAAFLEIASGPAAAGRVRFTQDAIYLNLEDSNRLKDLAKLARVPIKSVMFALHLKTLSLLTGRSDILTGIQSNGRQAVEGGEQIYGLFLNALPFHIVLRPGTWLELIRQTFENELSTLPHRRYPLAAIQEAKGGAPLFEVFFNYLNFHVARDMNASTRLTRHENLYNDEPNNYPLSANPHLDPVSGGLDILLCSDSRYFDKPALAELLEVYRLVMRAMIESVEVGGLTPHHLLDPCNEAERSLLASWNPTTADLPEQTVLHRFEQIVKAKPHAAALKIQDAETVWSFEALDAFSNRIAHLLRDRGVGEESVVAMRLARSGEAVAAILGILKAGATYLPLDANHPPARLTYMIEDSGARCVISDADHAEQAGATPLIWLRDLDGYAATPPNRMIAPNQAAYVIYSSGSTGQPKGIAVSHAALSNYLGWAAERYMQPEGEGVALHTSLAFDLSITGLFLPLITGKTLVLFPEEPGAATIETLSRCLALGTNFDFLKMTPSHLRALTRLGGDNAIQGVRRLILGGEALNFEDLRALKGSGIEIVNEYGPTEAVVGCCLLEVESETDGSGEVPIGRPTPNTRLYILDDFGQQVRPGAPAELWIGGSQLARGYVNRPELTADRFRPDPLSELAGARRYRTGDRVRMDAQGNLVFMGRFDDQIKIRGYRIEIGEIETALARHPALTAAAVVLREDANGDPVLAAYASVGEAVVEPAELRGFLEDWLPASMIPASFTFLPVLPLTPNGKIDRAALPEPDAMVAKRYRAPDTDTETALTELWTHILQIQKIGKDDDFFALGGHSLNATILTNRIAARFSIPISVRDIFTAPGLEDLALRIDHKRLELATPEQIEAGRERLAARWPVPLPERLEDFPAMLLSQLSAEVGGDRATAIPAIPRTGRVQTFPLSFAQHRLWFLDQLEKGSPTYNVPLIQYFEGRLEVAALRAALDSVIARHESLRTRFPARDGSPVQEVRPSVTWSLPVLDFSALPLERARALIGDLAERDALSSFDLAEDSLFRFRLCRIQARGHVLLANFHHIITDAWSQTVLEREIALFYGADPADRPSLPTLTIQYADYAQWQREAMTGAVLEHHLDYWREKLAAPLPILELPTDRTAAKTPSNRGENHSLSLDAAQAELIRAFCQERRLTPFLFFLAAYQLLLARYAGQDDILVGVPIAARNRAEIEPMVGFFVNTLVIRGNSADRGLSFEDYVGQIRETMLGAHQHQDLPFEQLVDALLPDRAVTDTPLFRTVFNYGDHSFRLADEPKSDGESQSGPRVTQWGASFPVAKFDLTLDVRAQDHRFDINLNYRQSLFEPATIGRIASHLKNLALGLVQAPHGPVTQVSMLEADERALLVSGWHGQANPTPVQNAFAGLQSLHQGFELRARRAPESGAVTFNGETLSYGELNRKANRLAHTLIERGAGPERRIGICLERSADLLVALLAVLKTGALYAPMDPSYPGERLRFIAEDADLTLLLAGPDQADLFGDRPVLTPDSFADGARAETNPDVAVLPENAAYLIYTSGSTGRPKGVAVTHRHVLRLFGATEHWFAFNERDVWSLFHSYAFDFSVWEIWGALLYGGRLVVTPHWVTRQPEAFFELMVRESVTVLNQSPTAFAQLVGFIETGHPASDVALGLRYVIFGAEALDVAALKPWFERFGDQNPRLVNMYGITETCVHVTYQPITAETPHGPSPIGVGIPDLDIYVLDKGLNPAPFGAPGEIHVGGAGPARGYLNRPELTAERFVPDPFARSAGERLYRAGDRARIEQNGDLIFLGRIDHQVKIHGYRIETGEIQAVLAEHPDIARCFVMARPVHHRSEDGARHQLVAYAVTRARVTVLALRDFLAEKLPNYMIPAKYVFLDAFPMTAHGKLDVTALPDPARTRETETEYEPPVTVAEEVLAAVWSEALDVDRVGRTDNFFALGADSILSVRVVALAKKYGVLVSLQQLFRFQTIESLARNLATDGLEQAPLTPVQPFALISPEIRAQLPEDVIDAYPMCQLQLGMIFHMELDPEALPFHNVDSYRLKGPIVEAPLRRAAQMIVDRHTIFRTGLHLSTYDEPIQIVHRRAELAISWFDLRHLPEETQAAELQTFLKMERRTPFDLTKPTLLRFAVHRHTDDVFSFSVTECHPILDGWSINSAFNEMFALYFQILDEGEPEPQPPPAATYRDFIRLEQAALQSEETRSFWDAYLDQSTRLLLPDGPAPAAEPYRTTESTRLLPPDLTRSLKRMARLAGVPLKSVMLAVHLKALNVLTGKSDILTGLQINGRPEIEGGDQVYGLFLNIMPYRIQIPSGTWLDLIRAAFEYERIALPHRRYPISAIQEQRGEGALFDIFFNYLHFYAARDMNMSDRLELVGSNMAEEPNNYPLTVTVHLDAVTGDLNYGFYSDNRHYDTARLDEIMPTYQRILRAMAASLEADGLVHHDQESFLEDKEKQCLAAWLQTDSDYPREPIHALFAESAKARPHAIALATPRGREHLSYARLDHLADQIAGTLRQRGAGPDHVIGVLMDRSPHAVIAALAILKAGGAYLPLSPALSPMRLAFTIRDANCRANPDAFPSS